MQISAAERQKFSQVIEAFGGELIEFEEGSQGFIKVRFASANKMLGLINGLKAAEKRCRFCFNSSKIDGANVLTIAAR